MSFAACQTATTSGSSSSSSYVVYNLLDTSFGPLKTGMLLPHRSYIADSPKTTTTTPIITSAEFAEGGFSVYTQQTPEEEEEEEELLFNLRHFGEQTVVGSGWDRGVKDWFSCVWQSLKPNRTGEKTLSSSGGTFAI